MHDRENVSEYIGDETSYIRRDGDAPVDDYFASRKGKAKLEEIRKEIEGGDALYETTPRQILRMFGYRKRGRHVRATVRGVLAELELEISPALNAVSLDDPVMLKVATVAEVGTSPMQQSGEDGDDSSSNEQSDQDEADVVALVGTLPTARSGVVGAQRQDTLTTAITTMMMHGYSQLPVLSGRGVVGVISWSCIGRAVAKKREISGTEEVQQFMGPIPAKCRADEPLFDVMQQVIREEYVLVEDETRAVSGIITTTDLAEFLRDGYEAFALLAQIEALLRQCLNREFTSDQLRTALAPGDASRVVSGAQSLTFGEYRRFLENQANWDRLGLRIDRVGFLKHMERVNEIRNDVMHFAEEGVSDEDVQDLRRFLTAIRHLLV